LTTFTTIHPFVEIGEAEVVGWRAGFASCLASLQRLARSVATNLFSFLNHLVSGRQRITYLPKVRTLGTAIPKQVDSDIAVGNCVIESLDISCCFQGGRNILVNPIAQRNRGRLSKLRCLDCCLELRRGCDVKPFNTKFSCGADEPGANALIASRVRAWQRIESTQVSHLEGSLRYSLQQSNVVR
jgi:hypothetical protein